MATQQAMDPILTKVQQQTAAKVPPALKNSYQRIILAGHRVMYSPQTHKMMVQQMNQGQPANAVGDGIAKLLGILMHQSHGTLNMKAAIPAMTYLMCDALDFMEKAGKVQVTSNLVAATTKEMGSAILQILGVSPQRLQTMVDQGKQQQGIPPGQPVPPPSAQKKGGIINGGA